MTGTWVLLRGLARESGHWGGFVDQLQAALPAARIVALDLPGTGHLRHQASPLRVEAIAARCQDVLRALGASPPYHLLGMSLGGMVAAHWILSRPDDVAAGVLINSSLRPLSPWAQRLRPAAWGPLLRAMVDADGRAAEARILSVTSNVPEARRQALGRWTELRDQRPVGAANALRQLVAAARYRIPDGRPAVPMFLLCSGRDRLVDARCSQALARHWKCRLAVHPTAGHDLALDDPAWVVEQVAREFGGRRPGVPPRSVAAFGGLPG